MNFYRRFIFPILRRLDPERAHEGALALLEIAQRWPPGPLMLRLIAGPIPQQPVHLFGLTFPNPLGLAAGFDKDIRVVRGLALLGFGHIEVGTLTPRPQPGNPKPRLFRLPEDGALINRMGFPNAGVTAALPRLRRLSAGRRSFQLGVSLGKQKETPLAEAADDYVAVMRAVYPYADYLAVNISSPNTPGLRELQGGAYLARLLSRLCEENETLAKQGRLSRPRPLLVKIAPDLTPQELAEMLDVIQSLPIAGIIAVNTTLSRGGVSHPAREESGGLSGRPLATRSNEIIAAIHAHTGGSLPIIGVGGVFNAADLQAKLEAGASLVQLYSGLVYQGPGIAGQILRGP